MINRMLSQYQLKKILENTSKEDPIYEYILNGRVIPKTFEGTIPEAIKYDAWFMFENEKDYLGPPQLFSDLKQSFETHNSEYKSLCFLHFLNNFFSVGRESTSPVWYGHE